MATKPSPIPSCSLCEAAALDAAAAVPDDVVAVLVPDAVPDAREVVDGEVLVEFVAPVVPLLQEATVGKMTPDEEQISCAYCCVLTWSAGEHACETQHERPCIQPDDLQIHVTSSCWHPVPEVRLLPTQVEAHVGNSRERAVAASATMAEKAERRMAARK